MPCGGVVGEVLAAALGMNQGYSSPATIVQTTRPVWAGPGRKDWPSRGVYLEAGSNEVQDI